MNAYHHYANGANMVEYWHWHSNHYGNETYWKGILSHDLEPNRAYREVSRTAKELASIGPHLVNLRKKNQVAILYSNDSLWGIEHMPFSKGQNYSSILHKLYQACYAQNIGTDFIFPDSENFADYKVILVPPLYVATDALLKRLRDFVKQGGHVLFSLKSGFCDENVTVRATRMPGVLREVCGVSYQEFSNVRKVPLKDHPFGSVEADNQAEAWIELLIPETASAIVKYEHPFFGEFPAVTRNSFGKGKATYVGTVLSNAGYEKLVKDIVDAARAGNQEQTYHFPLVVKSGVNDLGKKIHYFLNYSSTPQKVAYVWNAGRDLLRPRKVRQGAPVELLPWEVAIFEEP